MQVNVPVLSKTNQSKLILLRERIRALGSVVVAFSGGIDSSLVARLAVEELGEKALAVTSGSASLKRDDLVLTSSLAAEWGLAHRQIVTRELTNPDYAANPVNRCYYCKSSLYQELRQIADQEGYLHVISGTNADDLGDHRPGLRAADEFGVIAPLAELGIGKPEIRELARHLEMRNAEKPQAACLSSRVPYGTAISPEILGQIERAEQVLTDAGFMQCRVRHHGPVARLELLPGDFSRALAMSADLQTAIQACGYEFVALDLRGFRSGSMNALIARDIDAKDRP